MQENERLHFFHIPWFWKATPHERRTTRLKRLTWNFSHQIFRAALTNAGLLPKRAMPQRPWRPWHRYHLIRVINCQPVYVMQPCIPIVYTLPETKIAPENGWLEDDPFLLGWPIFRCYVSFREGILLLWKLWMLFKKQSSLTLLRLSKKSYLHGISSNIGCSVEPNSGIAVMGTVH